MYIKQLEIDNFKSFASKAEIPLLKGFTTVSGPNGSGKSNIIDSVMFALGLRTGSALRIENLSDFITIFNNRNEAIVKVTFGDVDGDNELSVARRIRKTNQGYVSTYYLNDKIDTLTNIRLILEKYNITPNSYNVMMQGDVTSIVMCSPKARRGIIDEIAGVADFDRRIDQATNELKTVEDRVNAALLILQEVEVTLEQLKTEREDALKYKRLLDEKSQLEAQKGTVKFFDLKRCLEVAHENILQSNKKLKEEQFNKKDLEEKIKLVQVKYNELDAKLKAQGEDERNKLVEEKSNLTSQVQTKNNSINYAQNQINNGYQSIENAKNGINKFNEKIKEAELNIKLAQDKIEIKKIQRQEKQEEYNDKLAEVAGLSSSADKYIEDRKTLTKELDSFKDKDNDLLKELLPKENDLKILKKEIEGAKEFIKNALEQKKNFGDNKSLKELEVNELKTLMEELRELQTRTMQQLDEVKSTVEDYEHDIRIAYRKFSELEAQKSVMGSGGSNIPITTVMNAHIEGVHAPLMQLGDVEDEYITALDIALGGRLANIVVDDPHCARVAMEVLKSSQGGRATFLPLNKLKKAPTKLQLPKNSGVIDFAINLIDFDDVYLDAFYYAVGDTIIVEDSHVAEPLIGKYRMVTLDGTLYEKSSAMTGGYIKKSSLSFSQNTDKELENAKRKIDDLQNKHNAEKEKKNSLESKLEEIRKSYSTASTEYSKAKLELSNMNTQFNNSQNLLEVKQTFVKENEPKIEQLTNELDKIEEKRVILSDNIQETQNKINEIDELLNDKDLKDLKEKTQDLEDNIRHIENEINGINNEIIGYNNTIKFNEQLIISKNEDITNTQRNIKSLEDDKVTYSNDIQEINIKIEKLTDTISEIDEKIGELSKEKESINQNLIDLQTKNAIKESEIDKINEQIESFKLRRKDLEPQLEAATNLLKESGVEISKLEPIEMSIDELNGKIEKLDKKMKDLGDVNMRAITSYEEKSKRKEELDTQINTLSTERQSIIKKMSSFEQQKKEAFMTTFTQINENFKDIYHQLSEGEGQLILENEKDPLTAGMTIEAKPRDKTTTNKLSALSGGEKALTALALVFSIQKYLPAPFYALDEVDASLDTMNVERIAEMVKKQSSDTQFIVVSHRRPMIESANRTLGVTQKEKGKTKVTGISINE